MLIIDCKFLRKQVFTTIIKQITHLIRVRNIENIMLFSSKYVEIQITIYSKLESVFVCNKLRAQVYIINNLKTNLFIEFDILKLQKINLNYKKKFLVINNCKDIIIFIIITSIKNKINCIIQAFTTIIMFTYIIIFVSICFRDKIELS